MGGPDAPPGNVGLSELFIVHVGTFACEIGSDAMGRTAAFVPVPFFGIVFPDPVDDLVWFLSIRTLGMEAVAV